LGGCEEQNVCLIVAISVAKDTGAVVAPRLSALGPLKLKPSYGGWFSKHFHIEISEDGTCACSMMHDDDGPDPGVCRVRDDLLEALARTVSSVADVIPTDFSFAAMWISDKPRETPTVRLPELLELIRNNRLGERTEYRVTR
jgi:hypothetical protein